MEYGGLRNMSLRDAERKYLQPKHTTKYLKNLEPKDLSFKD
jgi:hypothetical protein